MNTISRQHGSPHDRGGADYWYHRPRWPHWYPNGTGRGKPVEASQMTPEQIAEYHAGYDEAEKLGHQKEWT